MILREVVFRSSFDRLQRRVASAAHCLPTPQLRILQEKVTDPGFPKNTASQ